MGGAFDEDSEGPLSAPSGASGHHDECFRPDPSSRREGHQERNGSICQQHHFCPLPVSQPAGAARGPFEFMSIWSYKTATIVYKCCQISISDCQYTGQSCCHIEQEVRERGLLHEHSEHCTAGSEVSPSFEQPPHVFKPLIYISDWISNMAVGTLLVAFRWNAMSYPVICIDQWLKHNHKHRLTVPSCLLCTQVPQWHQRSYEGSGDGPPQAVFKSGSSVSAW